MRSLLLAGALCSMIAGAALAQNRLGDGDGQGRQHTPGQPDPPPNAHRHNDAPPPPPPIPRCPDLAVSTYSYVTAIPGAPALAADEVAIQFEVRNAGTASYIAASGAQNLTLSYTTPGGPHQVASIVLPPASGNQAAAHSAELGPQQTWTGYMRATLTPADRRWPLHLSIDYGQGAMNLRGLANDCNTNNNDIILARP
jgi:hypothetical protein